MSHLRSSRIRLVLAGLLGTTACAQVRADAPTTPVSEPRAVASVPARPAVNEAGGGIEAKALRAHIQYLASDRLEGRAADGQGARLAAEYIAEQFRAFGLQPAGADGEYFQALAQPGLAPNVVAVRPGRSSHALVIGAHYDHLAPAESGDDRIFNGADDNASGTAAVLELARSLAQTELELPTLIFVAFSAEEMGLLGSRHFVGHLDPQWPPIAAMMNLDMISRGPDNLIFCEGRSQAESFASYLDRANARIGMDLRHDQHPEWRERNDQWPFLEAGIPALYLGVEDHPDYHKVSDHADKVVIELAVRVTRLVHEWVVETARALADDPKLSRTDERRVPHIAG